MVIGSYLVIRSRSSIWTTRSVLLASSLIKSGEKSEAFDKGARVAIGPRGILNFAVELIAMAVMNPSPKTTAQRATNILCTMEAFRLVDVLGRTSSQDSRDLFIVAQMTLRSFMPQGHDDGDGSEIPSPGS